MKKLYLWLWLLAGLAIGLAPTPSWAKSRESVIPKKVIAADITTSAAAVQQAVVGVVGRQIGQTFTERNGLGADLELIAIGSGPSDIQKASFSDFCTRGPRVCTDPKRIEKITRPMIDKATSLFASRPTKGSDPIGGVHQVLARSVATRPKDQRIEMEVYSDFYERSDVLAFDTTDLSSRRSRSAAADALKSAGLDFATVRLTKNDIVNAHIVPGDTAAGSGVRTEQIRAFVELLLLRTGASVTVTVFEPEVQ